MLLNKNLSVLLIFIFCFCLVKPNLHSQLNSINPSKEKPYNGTINLLGWSKDGKFAYSQFITQLSGVGGDLSYSKVCIIDLNTNKTILEITTDFYGEYKGEKYNKFSDFWKTVKKIVLEHFEKHKIETPSNIHTTPIKTLSEEFDLTITLKEILINEYDKTELMRKDFGINTCNIIISNNKKNTYNTSIKIGCNTIISGYFLSPCKKYIAIQLIEKGFGSESGSTSFNILGYNIEKFLLSK